MTTAVSRSGRLRGRGTAKLARLKGSLGQAVNRRQDQVIILDLGPADRTMDARLECIGMAYSPPARVTVI